MKVAQPQTLLKKLEAMDLGTIELYPSSLEHRSFSKPGVRLRKRWVVQGHCCECNQLQTFYVEGIFRGLTTTCACMRNRKYLDLRSKVLGERYDAILQRCRDTGTDIQKNYGARGIRCLFESREQFILYMLSELPHPDYKGVDIDRVDNEGHYEPGNLRLATRAQNLVNKRTTKVITCNGQTFLGLRAFQQWVSSKVGYEVTLGAIDGRLRKHSPEVVVQIFQK